ncbi:MAG TPA: ParB/RepB/Spo0J family partition protein, partial [bacterium]|nr:ParB/RepB/Spo0J family partition protein [bacterium]
MKKVLGKGLSALIPDTYVKEIQSKSATAILDSPRSTGGGFQLIPVAQIAPNSDQPRKEFNQEKTQELAASIREKGIMQPVIVKKIAENKYRLICGERRFRAAQLCGLTEIPAVVKDIAQDDFLEWALIENIQRQDLNPLEEAEAYRRLAEERMLSQDEIAKRVGKDRSSVANMMRLLRLPEEIRLYI